MDDLATLAQKASTQVSTLVSDTSDVVRTLPWSGDDYDTTVVRMARIEDGAGNALVDALRKIATIIKDNAEAQRAVSGSLSGQQAAPKERRDLKDPKQAKDEENTKYEKSNYGDRPLFDGDPESADVAQGVLNDCYLAGALASLATANPDLIKRLITDNGDGTYTVHLAGGDVTVDADLYGTNGQLAYAGYGRADAPLWPMIIEKAIAQQGGGYESINHGGTANDLYKMLGAKTDQFKLNPSLRPDPSDASLYERIDEALADGRPVAAGDAGLFGMGGVHQWSVEDVFVDPKSGERMITIRNPWGTDGLNRLNRSGAETDLSGTPGYISAGDANDGFITMPLSDFTREFDDMDIVTEWK